MVTNLAHLNDLFVKDLTQVYQKTLFHKLSLEFKPSQLVAFLGPSGCGKTTLIKILAGLEKPTNGQIHGFSEKRKAFVFQDPRLLPWLTVVENILIGQTDLSENSQLQSLVEQWLKKLKLEGCEKLFPEQLSGGMKMRVSLARALLKKPELIFFDEPFSALDETTRFFLQEDLRQLFHEQKWNGFFVTHSVDEAVFLADRIILMSAQGENFTDIEISFPEIRNAQLRMSAVFLEKVNEVRRKKDRQ